MRIDGKVCNSTILQRNACLRRSRCSNENMRREINNKSLFRISKGRDHTQISSTRLSDQEDRFVFSSYMLLAKFIFNFFLIAPRDLTMQLEAWRMQKHPPLLPGQMV